MKRPSFDIDGHSRRLSTTFYEELTNSEEGLGGESVSVVFATDGNVDRSVDTFTDSIQIAPQEEEGCIRILSSHHHLKRTKITRRIYHSHLQLLT